MMTIDHLVKQSEAKYLHKMCSRLHEPRSSTLPEIIGCFPGHFLSEALASKFNFSVEYRPVGRTKLIIAILDRPPDQIHYSVFLVVNRLGWLLSGYGSNTQVLYYSKVSKFIYCTKSKERKSISWLFWAIPFDDLSWILLLISIVSLKLSVLCI